MKIDLSSIQNKPQAPKKNVAPKQLPPSPRLEKKHPPQPEYKIPKQPKPAKIVKSVTDDYDRLKKIKVLELYKMEFPEKLKAYKSKKLDNLSHEELDELKTKFEYDVSSSSNIGMVVSASNQFLYVYENVGQLAGLEIEGISKMSGTEEWEDTIKALALKYLSCPISQIPPEYKLFFMLLSNTLILHQTNSARKERTKVEGETASLQPVQTEADMMAQKLKVQNINSKYSDL